MHCIIFDTNDKDNLHLSYFALVLSLLVVRPHSLDSVMRLALIASIVLFLR